MKPVLRAAALSPPARREVLLSMFGIVGYPAFVLSAVLLNMTPGADTIYILSKGAVGGRRCGVASALGISTGILIHTALAALGLSIILAQSALAFNLLKLAGAAYLIAMGVRTILSKKPLFSAGGAEGPREEGLGKVYRQGVLTNALNPKVALFFLALLPQFVDPASTFGPLPFLLLGLTFFTTCTIWCLFIAVLSGLVCRVLQSSARVQAAATKVSGGIYILLGLNVFRARAV